MKFKHYRARIVFGLTGQKIDNTLYTSSAPQNVYFETDRVWWFIGKDGKDHMKYKPGFDYPGVPVTPVNRTTYK